MCIRDSGKGSMKYLIISLLLLTSCGKFMVDPVDQDLKDLKQSIERNRKLLMVVDCEVGIFYTIDAFKVQLHNKISKKQFDDLFQQCEHLGESSDSSPKAE